MVSYYSQASGVGDGTGKLSVAYPLHATLDNGHYVVQSIAKYVEVVVDPTSDAQGSCEFSVERHVFVDVWDSLDKMMKRK